MQEVFEKIIKKLEKELKLADEEKLRCARENPLQFDSAKGYAHGVGKAIEIVKQEAEQYEECYNDCGDCEAYNKEKHHCPKFCKVIKETVKEIEENHNGWIPCSERMPEDEQVVITCKYKSISILRYSTKTNHWYELNGNWWWSANMVTAWQPLPQPYQPKGE